MWKWRNEEIGRHGAPLRLGQGAPDQQHALFIDFAPAAAFPVIVAATPLISVSLPAYFAAVGLAATCVLRWLKRRTTRVEVVLVAGELQVRNVFRAYRIPMASVTAVVGRRSWVGGMYAFCFGVRTRGRFDALPGRSVPLHALTGAASRERQLRVLLQQHGGVGHPAGA